MSDDKIDRRTFGKKVLKKALWIAPVLTAISTPETVTASQSGWDNTNPFGNDNRMPPGGAPRD